MIVVDRKLQGRNSLPYEEDDLQASLEALTQLRNVGLRFLNEADGRWREDVTRDAKLFRLDYNHLLLREDLEDLFDTSPDLTGDDIDISRFIREGEENNVQIAWFKRGNESNWELPNDFRPQRRDLCPAPLKETREWLTASDMRSFHGERVGRNFAYRWDFDDSRWKPVRSDAEILPGRILLVDYRCGGYTNESGFQGKKAKVNKKYEGVPDPVDFSDAFALPKPTRSELADAGQSLDPVSKTENAYVSISDHGLSVAKRADEIASVLELDPSLRRRAQHRRALARLR